MDLVCLLAAAITKKGVGFIVYAWQQVKGIPTFLLSFKEKTKKKKSPLMDSANQRLCLSKLPAVLHLFPQNACRCPWLILICLASLTHIGLVVLLPWRDRDYNAHPTKCSFVVCSVLGYYEAFGQLIIGVCSF